MAARTIMSDIANTANQAQSLLSALSDHVDKLIKMEKDAMDLPDTQQMKTFIAACDQDLSDNIKKLVKLEASKKAEIAKLAKTIKDTVKDYEEHLGKLTGVSSKMFADANLAPQLDKIKKVVKEAVKSQALSVQDIDVLKKAQTAWSDAKPKGLTFCKNELAEHVKMKLETIKEYQSDLKSLNVDTHAKLLKGLSKIDNLTQEQAKATVKSLTPLITNLAKDALQFSTTRLGDKNAKEFATDLKEAAGKLALLAKQLAS